MNVPEDRKACVTKSLGTREPLHNLHLALCGQEINFCYAKPLRFGGLLFNPA